jgi:hypothetical protein
MADQFLQLVVYGLAAAFAAPVAAVVSALVLGRSRTPVSSSSTFVLGALLLDLVVVLVFYALAADAVQGNDDIGAWIDIALGVMFLLLGAFAVRERPDPEKDAAQRARAERIASGGLVTLLAAGLVVQVINFDAIAVMAGGLKEIVQAGVDTGARVVYTAFLLILMLLPYWLPIAIFVLAPDRAKPALARMTEWILGNARMLEIVCGFGFGVVFAVKGLTSLLG